MSIVHVFPDADSMDLHVEGTSERSKVAYEFIEPVRREIYGIPSDRVMAMIRLPDGSGDTLSVKPQLIDGYIRFKSE